MTALAPYGLAQLIGGVVLVMIGSTMIGMYAAGLAAGSWGVVAALWRMRRP